MTHNQMHSAIGKHAQLRVDGFTFAVIITDAKLTYGQLRFAVTPENGTGTQWVDAGRVVVQNADHHATVLP